MRVFPFLVAIQLSVAALVDASSERPSAIGHVSLKDASGAITPGKAILVSAPAPGYPYIARKNGWEGAGVFVMHIDHDTGVVRSVTVEKSTGYAMLDRAAIEGFSKWKYKIPLRCARDVRCPIRYFVPKHPKTSNHTMQPTASPRTASLYDD